MDEQISRWIVEFLVRQRVDDSIVQTLLSTLPLREDDFQLKKALLLRKIRAEVANATVSEKVLDLLQLIADIEFREGVIASETMKTAYCAVAVDCTVRFLEEEMENDGKYMEYLKRIWRGRVHKMETSENSGLVSENLQSWKEDLEAASRDVELRGKILLRNTRNEALKAVKRYLAEAWNDMGPTFLEKIAGNVDKMEKVGRQDRGIQVSENDEFTDIPPHSVPVANEPEIDSDGGRTNADDCHNMPLNETGVEKGYEGVVNAVEPQDGMVSNDKPAMDGIVEDDISVQEPIPRCDKAPDSLANGATPTCATNTGDGSSATAKPDGEQSIPLQQGPSLETGRVSAVRYKHVPLRSRSKRHRPAKIVDLDEMDEDISVDKNNEIHPPGVSGSQDGHDPKKVPLSTGAEAPNTVNTPVDNADDIQLKDSTMEDVKGDGDNFKRCPGEEGPNSPGKATLVDKSPATFTKEDLGESSAGACLSSPKKRKTKRRWTSSEEDTLRAGVKRFGKGNWKFILYAYRDAFQGRSEVDLKDKWRNMTR